MALVGSVDRIPWTHAERLLAAFEKAREYEAMTPLEGLLRERQIEGLKVERKKKLLWFGKGERFIAGGAEALALALERDRLENLDVEDAPAKLLGALAGSAEDASAAAVIREVFAPDHGLPAWLADQGPSLVAPGEIAALGEALEKTRGAWEVAGVTALMSALAALVARCGAGEGLLLQ